jgi:peptidoglycan/LPS O-acetylase OafA/YrhL
MRWTEGRWWRFWIALNDNSMYIGVFIISLFLSIILGYLLFEFVRKRRRKLHFESDPELSNASPPLEPIDVEPSSSSLDSKSPN